MSTLPCLTFTCAPTVSWLTSGQDYGHAQDGELHACHAPRLARRNKPLTETYALIWSNTPRGISGSRAAPSPSQCQTPRSRHAARLFSVCISCAGCEAMVMSHAPCSGAPRPPLAIHPLGAALGTQVHPSGMALRGVLDFLHGRKPSTRTLTGTRYIQSRIAKRDRPSLYRRYLHQIDTSSGPPRQPDFETATG